MSLVNQLLDMPEETTTTDAVTPKSYRALALNLIQKHALQHVLALRGAWQKVHDASTDPRKLYRHKIITGQIEPLAHVTLQNLLIEKFRNGEPEVLELSDIFRSHPEVSKAKEVRANIKLGWDNAKKQLNDFVAIRENALDVIDADPSYDDAGRFKASMALVGEVRDYEPVFPDAPALLPSTSSAPAEKTPKKKKVAKRKNAAAAAAPTETASLEAPVETSKSQATGEIAAPEAAPADPLG